MPRKVWIPLCVAAVGGALFICPAGARAAAASYPVTPITVPGAVEAEHYMEGGEGVGYHDLTTANEGGKLRDDGVDIQKCSDMGGGYAVSQIGDGEWLRYSIRVPISGAYRVSLRLGLDRQESGSIRIWVDDDSAKVLGPINFPAPPKAGTVAWQTVAIPTALNLSAGNHTLRVIFQGPIAAAQFNYLQVTPPPPASAQGSTTVNVIGLVAGEVSDSVAVTNAKRIEQAVSNLPAAGGTVRIPSGTYYLAQSAPSETPYAGAHGNRAVYVNRTDVRFLGSGSTQTILKAKNRATTLFYFGDLDSMVPSTVNVRRVSLESLGFTGNPYVASTGQPDDGGLRGDQTYSLGSLVVFRGDSAQNPATDVRILDCQFTNPNSRAIMLACARNVEISGNTITFFEGAPPPSGYSIEFGAVGVYEGGSRVENLQLNNNTFNGNASMSSAAQYAADGMAWLSMGGNWQISGNRVQNYRLEGVQVNAGPALVSANAFVTMSDNPSSCALNFFHNDRGQSVQSAASLEAACSFTGNTVQGGHSGVIAMPPAGLGLVAPFDVQISGNTIVLPNQFSQTTSPSMGVLTGYSRNVLMLGNSFTSGGRAVQFADYAGSNYVSQASLDLRFNDFSGVSWQSLYSQEPVRALSKLNLYGNRLGRGNTGHYHLQIDNVDPAVPASFLKLTLTGNDFVVQQTPDEPAFRFYKPAAVSLSPGPYDDPAIFSRF